MRPIWLKGALTLAMVIAVGVPAWPNMALRFVAAQKEAPAAAIVVATTGKDGELSLQVIRVIFGTVTGDLVPDHPDWFYERLHNGRQYVVLLSGGEAYRGTLTDDGYPMIGCGVVNTMEVANGQIIDPTLYDVKYFRSKRQLTITMVEQDLKRVHGRQGQGV